MGRLDQKVVVITGAAQGMGARHAQWCAEQGARVALVDVQGEKGSAIADGIGDQAIFLEHDVTEADGWRPTVERVLRAFGQIDGLVNNAAVHPAPIQFEEEAYETFERTLRVNLFGTWLGMQAVLPAIRERGGGSIVNISSTAGLLGLPHYATYGSSKWAVRGLTKSAARDLGRYRIRVNSVHPGGIAGTGMYPPASTADEEAARATRVPLGRVGQREDVSALVAFLLSDESSFITGVEHVVDGGSVLS